MSFEVFLWVKLWVGTNNFSNGARVCIKIKSRMDGFSANEDLFFLPGPRIPGAAEICLEQHCMCCWEATGKFICFKTRCHFFSIAAKAYAYLMTFKVAVMHLDEHRQTLSLHRTPLKSARLWTCSETASVYCIAGLGVLGVICILCPQVFLRLARVESVCVCDRAEYDFSE